MDKESGHVCICGLAGVSHRCAKCRSAYYCSKECQRADWKNHKIKCHQVSEVLLPGSSQGQSLHNDRPSNVETSQSLAVGPTDRSALASSQGLGENNRNLPGHLLTSAVEVNRELMGLASAARIVPTEEMSMSSASSAEWSSFSESSSSSCSSGESPNCSPCYRHDSLNHQPFEQTVMKRNTPEWIAQVCQFVIRDLDQYGICVVDNFLGPERGQAILESVESMYSSGVFREGETVNCKPKITGNIRGDKITWVDGTEPDCQSVAYLITMVDSIIMRANRTINNGKLGHHQISDRTKAMVACYPGSGTNYVKHVDNPNRDGRCITSIYYLNREWDVKTDGGLLRIFPQGWINQVADIEPIFDRMLFFWSDRRNPHEVQPAFRTRYAITLWYFDAKEREEARIRQKEQRECAIQSKVIK